MLKSVLVVTEERTELCAIKTKWQYASYIRIRVCL